MRFNFLLHIQQKMDTRFWGPSGWRLLHIITFRAKHLPQRPLHTFFKLLPYVLPCKFCRASLTDYYAADPVPTEADQYPHWLYRIHNRVSGKLREQKLHDQSDPSWDDIRSRYEKWVHAPCSQATLVGWDFFFSVAYTTPSKKIPSSPMYGAPPPSTLTSPDLQNRWNVLPHEGRIPYVQKWWKVLPDVLPYPTWQTAWKIASKKHGSAPVQKGRKAVTAWLYRIEKEACKHLNESVPHGSFEGLCSELSTFSSGCGAKSARAKTCRANKLTARKTLKNRRTRQYRAVGGFL
jgi:hypothetical protein